jgi:hypothetical protein
MEGNKGLELEHISIMSSHTVYKIRNFTESRFRERKSSTEYFRENSLTLSDIYFNFRKTAYFWAYRLHLLLSNTYFSEKFRKYKIFSENLQTFRVIKIFHKNSIYVSHFSDKFLTF